MNISKTLANKKSSGHDEITVSEGDYNFSGYPSVRNYKPLL
jgi:hypothetical protein